RPVAEDEIDAAGVQAAPAILAVVGVHHTGACVVVGLHDRRGDVRAVPGGALGIQIEAVGPERPTGEMRFRVVFAEEERVGRAVGDGGDALRLESGIPVAVERSTPARVGPLSGLHLVPEAPVGVGGAEVGQPGHAAVRPGHVQDGAVVATPVGGDRLGGEDLPLAGGGRARVDGNVGDPEGLVAGGLGGGRVVVLLVQGVLLHVRQQGDGPAHVVLKLSCGVEQLDVSGGKAAVDVVVI